MGLEQLLEFQVEKVLGEVGDVNRRWALFLMVGLSSLLEVTDSLLDSVVLGTLLVILTGVASLRRSLLLLLHVVSHEVRVSLHLLLGGHLLVWDLGDVLLVTHFFIAFYLLVDMLHSALLINLLM